MSVDVEKVGYIESRRIRDWLATSGMRATEAAEIDRLADGFALRTCGVNRQHVEVLAQNAESLPPIVVHRPSMRVIDGLHRVSAAQLAGRSTIDVEYFDGTEIEAFALSVHLNVGHGLPLEKEERKSAACVILIQNAEWSDRFVAKLVGLSHKTVSSIRSRLTGDASQSNSRLGCDGKVRPLDPVGGRLRAAQLLSENLHLPLRQVARRAGVSVSTARDVRIRIQSGRDLIPERLQSRRPDRSDSPPAPVELGQTSDEDSAAHDPMPSYAPITSAGPMPSENGRPRKPLPSASVGVSDILLQRLRKDPAIRYNEAGRSLIRRLVTTQAVLAELKASACDAPAHCCETVVQLAHNYADEWNTLASSIEKRARFREALTQTS